MASKPVLDLGSLDPERPYITIDGESYRMKVAMDVDLRILSRITTLDQKLEPKADDPAPSEETAREFSEAIDEGVGLIMYDEIPPEIMGKLNEIAKLAILEAFPLATRRAGSRGNRAARRAKGKRRSSTSRSSSPV